MITNSYLVTVRAKFIGVNLEETRLIPMIAYTAADAILQTTMRLTLSKPIILNVEPDTDERRRYYAHDVYPVMLLMELECYDYKY